MSEKPERCEIKVVSKGEGDWELTLSGDCTKTLQQLDSLAPRKRRYLQRRIRLVD